ncbi:hypothetical protein LQV05_006712 [Cryptococcus neoformans]|nr:hypothetical protein LQV05_006712 [Cryptococcus neoformans]
MSFQEFAPKKWDEDDSRFYCGICGSDVSSLTGEWGPVKDICPQVCGHEIVGEITLVVNANGARKENYCATQTITSNYPYNRGPNDKGSISRGGFAKYWRGSSKFAVPLPFGLEPDVAAPMLCGGVTIYSPLASVTAISRTDAKKEDAFKLGATDYFATGSNLQKAVKDRSRSLDFILCTISKSSSSMDFYPNFILRVSPSATTVPPPSHPPPRVFCIVGVIPTPLQVPAFPLIMHSACVAASNIGSPKEITEMFEFALKHNIKPWIQKWNFDDINKALPSFQKGDPRYRFVLVNTDNGGKL